VRHYTLKLRRLFRLARSYEIFGLSVLAHEKYVDETGACALDKFPVHRPDHLARMSRSTRISPGCLHRTLRRYFAPDASMSTLGRVTSDQSTKWKLRCCASKSTWPGGATRGALVGSKYRQQKFNSLSREPFDAPRRSAQHGSFGGRFERGPGGSQPGDCGSHRADRRQLVWKRNRDAGRPMTGCC
jgi:hypothetical protein